METLGQANQAFRRRNDDANEVANGNDRPGTLGSWVLSSLTHVLHVIAAAPAAMWGTATFLFLLADEVVTMVWNQVMTWFRLTLDATPAAMWGPANFLVVLAVQVAVIFILFSSAIAAILGLLSWWAKFMLPGFNAWVVDTQSVAIKMVGNCSIVFDGLTDSIGRMKLGVIDFVDAHKTHLLFVSVTMNFFLAYALAIKEGILARLDKATRAYDANLQAIMQRHVEETQAVGNAIANLDIKDQIGQALGAMGEETDMNGMKIKVTYHR